MSKETIGPKIKELRKNKKLTQEQLADILGYSGKSVISHIEKGDADMTYEKILLLLRELAVDANDLFMAEDYDRRIKKERLDKRKTKKVVVYIHGLNGSHLEANDYSFLKNEYDVVGLEYQDGNPWEIKDILRNKFKNLIDGYKEVVVIANSIGAFYTYEYLSDFNITHAFFISPIASMNQILFNYIFTGKVKKEELKEKKFITLEDGTVLSYDFFKQYENCDYHTNWDVPTDILYGDQDNLVYIENIASFLAVHPKARLTIKSGAEHWFHTDEEKKFIKEWIMRNL